MLTEKQLEGIIKNYNTKVKTQGRQIPLNDNEYTNISENIDNIPSEYKNYFDEARAGDFSHFQKLPHLLRNYLGTLEYEKFTQQCRNQNINNPDVVNYLKQNAMNPAFRAGVDMYKDKQFFKDCDAYMSNYIFQKTLTPPTNEEKSNLSRELNNNEQAINKALSQNMAKQEILAKTLFMAQLGKYYLQDRKGNPTEHNGLLTESFVHGGRTNFILPYGGDQQRLMESFTGREPKNDAGLDTRFSATHYINRREVNSAGFPTKEPKEIKPRAPGKLMSNQYGMNISAGGIGAMGPNNKVIQANGSAGHMYIRKELGDNKHCASLMIGFESSETGATSFTGHKHNALAKSSKQSSFLADKNGVGAKKGGRVVDLSGLDAETFTEMMNAFGEKYRALQANANNAKDFKKLQELNSVLCGKLQSPEKFKETLKGLGIDENLINRTVDTARKGFQARFVPENITRDKLEDIYRKKLSTEKACSLARQRFESAKFKDQIGAIKELQKTHETRSFFWKLRHPIYNSMEKSLISELNTKMVTEKGYSAEDMARIKNEFKTLDSFTHDYGSAKLNYSGPASELLKEHKNEFMVDERKNAKMDRLHESFAKEIDKQVKTYSNSRYNTEQAMLKAQEEMFKDDARGNDAFKRGKQEFDDMRGDLQKYETVEIVDSVSDISPDEVGQIRESIKIDVKEVDGKQPPKSPPSQSQPPVKTMNINK